MGHFNIFTFKQTFRGSQISWEAEQPPLSGNPAARKDLGWKCLKKRLLNLNFQTDLIFFLSSEQKGALMAKLRTKQGGMCEELNTLMVFLSLPDADFGAFLSFFCLCSPCGWGQVTWNIPYFPYF